ncbi:hypothetical protein NC652_004977 [Populus alba x Populus x berolinensis]|nr:hypothetical protein NC652_004977 [Populus alba x Populus x berolinensis]
MTVHISQDLIAHMRFASGRLCRVNSTWVEACLPYGIPCLPSKFHQYHGIVVEMEAQKGHWVWQLSIFNRYAARPDCYQSPGPGPPASSYVTLVLDELFMQNDSSPCLVS